LYLYLGQETVINTKEVIGIFDLDNASTSRITKLYLTAAQKSGRIIEITADIPKSFVVCEVGGRIKVYLSQISSSTLRKRTDFIKEIARGRQ